MHKPHKLTKKHLPHDAAGEAVDSSRRRDTRTPSLSIHRSACISISDDGIFYYWRLTRTLWNLWRGTRERMNATITYHRHWRQTTTRQCQTQRTCQLVCIRRDWSQARWRGVQITNADLQPISVSPAVGRRVTKLRSWIRIIGRYRPIRVYISPAHYVGQ